MKKLIAILLLVCLLPLCALAEMDEDGNVTIALGDAEVFFTPVEGSHVLTRESSASVFNKLGLRQFDMQQFMEANDVYAIMFFADVKNGTAEIQVCAYETTQMDFDELSVYGLEMNCEVMESLYLDAGYDVESVELCHTLNGHSYVRIAASYTDGNGAVEHRQEFYTCQSGYAVCVLLFPYDGAPTEGQIYQFEGLVDSLWVSGNMSADADE